MPTLASPQTAVVSVTTPNQVYRIKCLGASDVMQVSWVGSGGVSGQQTIRSTTTAGQDVGPFQDDTAITFRALSGSPSYEYGGPCGASEGGLLAFGAATFPLRMSGRMNAALVGDSILAHYTDPPSGQTLTGLGERSYITWAQRWSLGALTIGQNVAVAGSRLAAIISQADSVNAANTPVVFENGGVNDICGDDATVSYCISKKLELWGKLINKGCDVRSLSVLPVAVAGGGSTAKSQKILAFNQAMQTLAPRYGVRWIDLYSLFANPADGYPMANWTYDGLHPSAFGAYYAGKRIWSVMSADPANQGYLLASSAIDGYTSGTLANVWLENGLFTGTGAASGTGQTGNWPTGWTTQQASGSPTCVSSIVSDPDGFGNAFQVAITSTANGDLLQIQGTAGANGISVGDLVSGEVVLRVVSQTNLQCVIPWILVQVDGSNFFIYGGSATPSFLSGGLPAENLPYLLTVPPYRAANGSGGGTSITAMRFIIYAQFSGAGSATLQFSRARGRKVVTS